MKFKKQFIFPPACFAVMAMALFFLPISAMAEGITMKFQIPIGSLKEMTIDSNSIGKYILAIYNYLIGGVGILATVVMMYAGVLWITAGGSSEQIGKAKGYIGSALTGLILAFASYMILHTLNPDLLTFKPIELPPPAAFGCCKPNEGKASMTTETGCMGTWNEKKVAYNENCIDNSMGYCVIISSGGETGETASCRMLDNIQCDQQQTSGIGYAITTIWSLEVLSDSECTEEICKKNGKCW